MKKFKWEVMFEHHQKRFVTAYTETQARDIAKYLINANIKYVRKCNKR